jgi:hypothetical protein
MNRGRILSVLAIAFIFLVPILSGSVHLNPVRPALTTDASMDPGNGEEIDMRPGELLHKFTIGEQGNLEWVGTADPLLSGEFGNATDFFQQKTMTYLPSNTTSNTNVSISTGPGWEGYRVDARVSELTENRT